MATSIVKSRTQKKLLLNMRELAREMGVTEMFVLCMKKAGFPLPGGKATVDWALDWLKANPDFRQADHRPFDKRSKRETDL